MLQSESGIFSAGKETCTLQSGASSFRSMLSFEMIGGEESAMNAARIRLLGPMQVAT
jgi:acyl CoA:acetate/3-ketoacid CoA transferase beta subunit